MADSGKFEESCKRELSHLDKISDQTKGLVDKSSIIQERKQEVEVKLEIAKNVPDDIIEEIYPGLLDIQLREEKLLDDKVSHFVQASDVIMLSMSSSTGTFSAYQPIVFDPHQSDLNIYPNMDKVKDKYDSLAKDKSRKKETPKKLFNISADLGDMYVVVRNSVDKQKGGLINVNQAVMDMRNVLQQIWGALAQKAKEGKPEKWHGIQHKEFKKQKHRSIVADCLTDNNLDEDKLLILLNNMYGLFTEMSPTDLSKNPLSKDVDGLNILYVKWIVQIDDLVNIV